MCGRRSLVVSPVVDAEGAMHEDFMAFGASYQGSYSVVANREPDKVFSPKAIADSNCGA